VRRRRAAAEAGLLRCRAARTKYIHLFILKRLLADICAKSSRCRSRVAALQGCADKAHTSIDIKVHSLGVRWQAHEPLTIQYFNIFNISTSMWMDNSIQVYIYVSLSNEVYMIETCVNIFEIYIRRKYIWDIHTWWRSSLKAMVGRQQAIKTHRMSHLLSY